MDGLVAREDTYLCSQCGKVLFFPFVSMEKHLAPGHMDISYLCHDCAEVCILLDEFSNLKDGYSICARHAESSTHTEERS